MWAFSEADSALLVSELNPIWRRPSRLRMRSSRPTNVPPQMNRMCVVSIWMYCCSGCLPALRRDVGDRAFQHLQQRLLNAFAAHVAGDGDVLAGFADLVDFVDVDDPALGGF